MKLQKMTDEQLQNEYQELSFSIDNIECYSVQDLVNRELVETELNKRGYEAQNSVVFRKEEVEEEVGGA